MRDLRWNFILSLEKLLSMWDRLGHFPAFSSVSYCGTDASEIVWISFSWGVPVLCSLALVCTSLQNNLQSLQEENFLLFWIHGHSENLWAVFTVHMIVAIWTSALVPFGILKIMTSQWAEIQARDWRRRSLSIFILRSTKTHLVPTQRLEFSHSTCFLLSIAVSVCLSHP